jgi:hypothetical protein
MVMVLGFAAANPSCGSNAWIEVTNESINTGDNPSASGFINITGGKDSQTIPWGTLHSAVQDCLFSNQNCNWDNYKYTCDTRPAWKYRSVIKDKKSSYH